MSGYLVHFDRTTFCKYSLACSLSLSLFLSLCVRVMYAVARRRRAFAISQCREFAARFIEYTTLIMHSIHYLFLLNFTHGEGFELILVPCY